MLTIKPGVAYPERYQSNLINGITEWSSSERTKTFDYLKDKGIKIVADIGANNGVFTDKCLTELSQVTKVYAVEPDDVNFEILTYNLSENPKVSLHHCGIFYGVARGAVLGVGDNSPGGYMFAGVTEEHHGHWQGRVSAYEGKVFEMSPLETITSEAFDLIKVDTEGSEYNIVENSTTIKKARFLIIEFHNHLQEYVLEFVARTLPAFRIVQITNDQYFDPHYWYLFMENLTNE